MSDERRWLVLRARAGDRAALDRVLAELQEPLFRYLCGILADRSLAEDVLQDSLFLVFRKLGFLRDPDLLVPWALRIASREAFRRLKRLRRRREEPLDDAPEAAAPEPSAALDGELLASLPRHLAAVSTASRAVLALHYLNGLTLPEVAAVLGIAVGTAKSRLAYGLRSLRRALGEAER